MREVPSPTLTKQKVWLCRGGWTGSPSQAAFPYPVSSCPTKPSSPQIPAPFIHLLPVWLNIFASMAEQLRASVSPPVKRRLTDASASLEGCRHWEMTDIWGMLWVQVNTAEALPPLLSAHIFYQEDCQPYRHHYPHPRNEGKEPGTDTHQSSTTPKVNFSDISPNGWTKCFKTGKVLL